MDALEVLAGVPGDLRLPVLLNPSIELTQISPCAETGLQGAVNNESVRQAAERFERRHKFLQFFECGRTDLVERLAVKRQLDDAVLQAPGQSLSLKMLHGFGRLLYGLLDPVHLLDLGP